jgi:hypothetical protein
MHAPRRLEVIAATMRSPSSDAYLEAIHELNRRASALPLRQEEDSPVKTLRLSVDSMDLAEPERWCVHRRKLSLLLVAIRFDTNTFEPGSNDHYESLICRLVASAPTWDEASAKCRVKANFADILLFLKAEQAKFSRATAEAMNHSEA